MWCAALPVLPQLYPRRWEVAVARVILCAAVEGMAQPLSAQKHHLLPRLAETLQTATSPGRASLGVVPDCHVLIKKPWGSLC